MARSVKKVTYFTSHLASLPSPYFNVSTKFTDTGRGEGQKNIHLSYLKMFVEHKPLKTSIYSKPSQLLLVQCLAVLLICLMRLNEIQPS